MPSVALQQPSKPINGVITLLAVWAAWALFVLPLALGMAPPAHDGGLHDHHVQHTSQAPASQAPASQAPASEAPASEAPASEAPATHTSCEHFHICCACLVVAPTLAHLFGWVTVTSVDVLSLSAPRTTPKPPPRR